MEVISKQKIHSDVVFKQGCWPELESLWVKSKKKKMPKNWGLPLKLQVCQTTNVEKLHLEMAAHFQKVVLVLSSSLGH